MSTRERDHVTGGEANCCKIGNKVADVEVEARECLIGESSIGRKSISSSQQYSIRRAATLLYRTID